LYYAKDCVGVVTADADGQHIPSDIQKISQKLIDHPHDLIVGAREFGGKIPFRSRFGNSITRLFFRFIVGVKLSDTQSGLRAIPKSFVEEMLEVTTSGYDFELDMLMRAARQHIKISEAPIHTIYFGKNRVSHFNPLIDSLKIYFVFIRFTAISIMSALLDFVLFTVSYYLVGNVFVSIVFARTLSCIFNFIFGKCITFRSTGRILPEGIKFLILAILLVLISYGLITSMVNFLGMNVYVSKVISECTLFFMSFAVQRVFVFRPQTMYIGESFRD
jgi:putative flippase GtrA